MVWAHWASPWLRWGAPRTLCPLVLPSSTTRCSRLVLGLLLLPGVQHNGKLKVLLLSRLVQPDSVLLGCPVRNRGVPQTSPQSWCQLLGRTRHPLCCRVRQSWTLQGRVAGGGGWDTLTPHQVRGRISVFCRTEQASTLWIKGSNICAL